MVCAPFPAGLGGFFSDATGFAISQHTSDISPVATANPAHPGETITVYADGFYQVLATPADRSPYNQRHPVPIRLTATQLVFSVLQSVSPGLSHAGYVLSVRTGLVFDCPHAGSPDSLQGPRGEPDWGRRNPFRSFRQPGSRRLGPVLQRRLLHRCLGPVWIGGNLNPLRQASSAVAIGGNDNSAQKVTVCVQ